MTGTAPEKATADQLLAAATESVAAAAEAGIRMRLLGGIAVYQCAASSHDEPLRRDYHDFDVVVPAKAGNAAARVFRGLGYGEDREFNALHGAKRMIFSSPHDFVVDVIVGTFQMCHQLDLGHDLPEDGLTIDPADLLLTKLQIVQIEDKDLRDSVALLADLHVDKPGGPTIDSTRFTRPLAADWGFFHTVERNLPKVAEYAAAHLDRSRAEAIGQAVQSLGSTLHAAPKSMKWKMRARIGEKVTWYELPEEI